MPVPHPLPEPPDRPDMTKEEIERCYDYYSRVYIAAAGVKDLSGDKAMLLARFKAGVERLKYHPMAIVWDEINKFTLSVSVVKIRALLEACTAHGDTITLGNGRIVDAVAMQRLLDRWHGVGVPILHRDANGMHWMHLDPILGKPEEIERYERTMNSEA